MQHEIRNIYDNILSHLMRPLVSLPLDVPSFTTVPVKRLLLGLWWICAASGHSNIMGLLNGELQDYNVPSFGKYSNRKYFVHIEFTSL